MERVQMIIIQNMELPIADEGSVLNRNPEKLQREDDT